MSSESLNEMLAKASRLHINGQLEEAEALCVRVLRVWPDHAGALHTLGLLTRQRGRPDKAIALMRRSVELNPGAVEFTLNLVGTYRMAGLLEEARALLEDAVGRFSGDGAVRAELGLTLDKLGRYEEAVGQYRMALELLRASTASVPLLARTCVNVGSALSRLGRSEEALAAADEAIRWRYDYPLAHMNRADALFRLGRLAEAWGEYEWRWKRPNFTQKWPDYSQPAWDGSPLDGRTLLLWHEQGLGDTVHFCRYAPMAARGGGKVIVLCQPELLRLLRTLPQEVQVVADGQALPHFDLHLPLMSLPRIFATTMQTIPTPDGYLVADVRDVERWKSRLLQDTMGKLRVGIAWAGSPTHGNDRNRSLDLLHMAPLVAVPGIQLYSLQKGHGASQLKQSPFRERVIDFTHELADFADTAALMSALDLIVTVDTAVAHVAGALGLETWTLLPHEPDFRFVYEKGRSSWYSSMRLFRQVEPGDWQEVINRVAEALRSRQSST